MKKHHFINGFDQVAARAPRGSDKPWQTGWETFPAIPLTSLEEQIAGSTRT